MQDQRSFEKGRTAGSDGTERELSQCDGRVKSLDFDASSTRLQAAHLYFDIVIRLVTLFHARGLIYKSPKTENMGRKAKGARDLKLEKQIRKKALQSASKQIRKREQ